MNQLDNQFLYTNLARELGEKIKNNTFKTGEKLPSIRSLHQKLSLSISTVYKAYIELEKQGLIEAKPKSGYYVKHQSRTCAIAYQPDVDSPQKLDFSIPSTDALSPHRISIPSYVNQVLKAAHRPDFLQLGTAMISPEILPFRQLSKIMKDFSQKEMRSILSYSLTQGDIELRRQLSLRSTGFLKQIGANDLIITNGCTEALMLALRATAKEGDIIALESPAFYGILPLLEDLGLYAIEIPNDPVNGLNLEILEDALQKHRISACLVTPNFSNPLGSLMPDAHKQKLVQLANRFDMPIIEDNINTELFYTQKRPSLLKAFDRNNLVITCTSFSKTVAPGYRIGWIIPGPNFMERILKLKAAISVSNSTLDQQIMARFMSLGNYDRYLRSLRSKMQKQVREYHSAIKSKIRNGIKINNPAGGILLWIEMLNGADGLEVYQTALENKISILPGTIFSTSGKFRNFIRIGCGYPFSKKTENAIDLLGSIIRDLGKG